MCTKNTCKSVVYPLVILVSVRLEVMCLQCVGASSVDPQLVEHGVIVYWRFLHLCSPWCAWKLCEGSVGNPKDLQIPI